MDFFGLQEPYLDVILYLVNQRYQPSPPPKKNFNKICFILDWEQNKKSFSLQWLGPYPPPPLRLLLASAEGCGQSNSALFFNRLLMQRPTKRRGKEESMNENNRPYQPLICTRKRLSDHVHAHICRIEEPKPPCSLRLRL